ncbi:hypothetical protein [Pollutimonas bauzanensis]|uniref:Uncharacterized protein n=1 Tax=Pollutimonas bauzanensis TaxID=658167 RepID=A0A1M5Z3K2_9BURK|nr:hypothetical protein [Pollutimonas bauzanensis]SHI18842.1 hypothetical protein SAMN04488135_11245 [Pollutimonas bauzanensis]
MSKKFLIWLMRATKADSKTKDALAEDLRKIGVTTAGIGYVSIVMPQTNIAIGAGSILVISGFTFWLLGLVFTRR